MDESLLYPRSDITLTKQLPFMRGFQRTLEKYNILYKRNFCGRGSHAKIWMGIVVILYILSFIYQIVELTRRGMKIKQVFSIVGNLFVSLFYIHAVLNCRAIIGLFWAMLYGGIYQLALAAIFG